MDPAILSATAALVGSLVGGVSTFAAYWLTQRVQLRALSLMKRHAEREALYAEFIVEASKRFADGWSHQAESPEVVAGLYSAIERMRLTSSDTVIVAAEGVMFDILERAGPREPLFPPELIGLTILAGEPQQSELAVLIHLKLSKSPGHVA